MWSHGEDIFVEEMVLNYQNKSLLFRINAYSAESEPRCCLEEAVSRMLGQFEAELKHRSVRAW